MQLASVSPVTPRNSGTNTGPIGVASLGTLRIGHALNGIAYTDHKILAPLSKPFGSYTGSLQDAIKGAQAELLKLDSVSLVPHAVALLMDGTGWVARTITVDADVLRVIDHGAGTGGIASASFTDVSRSLAALVSSTGARLTSELR